MEDDIALLAESETKGAVIKHGTDRDGKDSTGSSKLLRGKRWASKLFQIKNMGHEIFHLESSKNFQSSVTF